MVLCLQRGEIAVHDGGILALVGGARFYSITYRLFKLPGLLEPACEDYGHVVTYKVRLQRLLDPDPTLRILSAAPQQS